MTDVDYTDDSIAYVTGHALGSSIPAELEHRNLPGICDGDIVPGAELALDQCGTECPGIWWVRLGLAYPSSNFPNQDEFSHGRRPILLAQQYEVGLVRGMDLPENGEAMDLADLNGVARLQLADMRALLQVICSYFRSTNTPFVVGLYTPYGPQGACVGGSWTVTAGLKQSD